MLESVHVLARQWREDEDHVNMKVIMPRRLHAVDDCDQDDEDGSRLLVMVMKIYTW